MGDRVQTSAAIYWHSSESMKEVADESAKLVIGASVYLGKDAKWSDYLKLYGKVYYQESFRILREDGYFVVIQTDAYIDGQVFPRNVHLPSELLQFFKLIDVKVWKRRAADFFQVPFSMVFVFAKSDQVKRPSAKKSKEYFQGIWDYPQTKGGAHNAYPDKLCELLVEAFTEPGDLIVDPFAGTGRLLGIAESKGRYAIGYEIDLTLKETIEKNLMYKAEGFF